MEPRISIITLCVDDIKRSHKFYHEGLGFPTSAKPDDDIVFFKTGGTCLALYPYEKFAEELPAADIPKVKPKYPTFTLAHNVKEKEDVNKILKLAEKAGGKIESEAKDTFWGGYSGYFSDPDGYLWEIAWAEFFKYNDDGSLVIE